MKVPAKTKMMIVKYSLSGEPLGVVERSGYISRQHQTGLEKLNQKYGGGKRLLQRCGTSPRPFCVSPVEEANLKELEIFTDHLTDEVKLEDRNQHQELVGISALRCNKSYQALFLSRTKNGCTGNPGRMDYPYFLNGYRGKLFIVWTSKNLRERTKKKAEDNVESKKHKWKRSRSQLPKSPHPSVLSATDLTK